MTRIKEIEGIGSAFAEKLGKAGIKSVEDLLQQAGSPKGRKNLAEQTGIDDSLILRWVNHADLYRIRGIAGQYAQLIEAAGVDTVVELARRTPENLLAKMNEVNKAKNMVNRMPSLSQVQKWVEEAKGLPRLVTY